MSGCNMRSEDNRELLLISELKNEVREMFNDVNTKLLIQDGKIAETCVFIKNNLSNHIREVLATMQYSKEIDEIINDVLVTELNTMLTAEPFVEHTNPQDVNVFRSVRSRVVRNAELGITYILTFIKNNLKPHVNFTNGTTEHPYSNHKSVIDYMLGADKPVAINSGLRGVTVKDGISHIEVNEDTNEGFYILCITPDGQFEAVPRTMTATEIIESGYRDAINIWSPIVENGVVFDETSIDSAHEDYDYIFNQKHPRQIVGVMPNGDYVVITIDGRMIDEPGANFNDIKKIVLGVGCRSAYNLDGGASTQTVIGKHLLNRKLSESRTIGTVITFESEVRI